MVAAVLCVSGKGGMPCREDVVGRRRGGEGKGAVMLGRVYVGRGKRGGGLDFGGLGIVDGCRVEEDGFADGWEAGILGVVDALGVEREEEEGFVDGWDMR